MNNPTHGAPMRRGANLADRLLAFAADIMAFAGLLPRDFRGRHIAQQVLRSGSSAGANYEEARAAESPADFAHKALVATKEMRETLFWLRLVAKTNVLGQEPTLPMLIREANELSAILMASARTARESK